MYLWGTWLPLSRTSYVAPAYSVSTVSFMCSGQDYWDSHNGCFGISQVARKMPWPTDLEKIRPEVAAIQEPFGNAVHACQQTDLRGKQWPFWVWYHWFVCHSHCKGNGCAARDWD